MATAFELGSDQPNSPSFSPSINDDGLHRTPEEALARRIDIAEREALDRAALARIETALLPLKLDRAGRRLDEALAAFRRARGDHAPHLPIDAARFAEAEREKDHADIAYRALVEQATGQKWTDVARRLAA